MNKLSAPLIALAVIVSLLVIFGAIRPDPYQEGLHVPLMHMGETGSP